MFSANASLSASRRSNSRTPSQWSSLEHYIIVDKIGSGAYGSVKKAEENKEDQVRTVALKIMRPKDGRPSATLSTLLTQETAILQSLNHDGIVRIYNSQKNAQYLSKSGKKYRCFYIAMELCEGGELFNYLAAARGFEEPMVRTLFEQLLDAVEYMHNVGIVHLDLKPENLLMGEYYRLKVADFGFAKNVGAENRPACGKVGSEAYAAPEVHLGQTYDGKLADIFSLGVILYVLRFFRRPLNKAVPNDQMYAQFLNCNARYWQDRAANIVQPPASPDLIDLFNRLLAANPQDRPSIPQIRTHPWMRGPRLSPTALQERLRNLFQVVQVAIQERKELARKKKRIVNPTPANFRALESSGSDLSLSTSQLSQVSLQGRSVLRFAPVVFSYFRLYLPISADEIASKLHDMFGAVKYNLKESSEKYRYEVEFGGEDEEPGKVRMEVFADDDVTVLDCKRISGCFFSFLDLFTSLKKFFESEEPQTSASPD